MEGQAFSAEGHLVLGELRRQPRRAFAVSDLSRRTHVLPAEVVKTVRQLERAGLVVTRRGHGEQLVRLASSDQS